MSTASVDDFLGNEMQVPGDALDDTIVTLDNANAALGSSIRHLVVILRWWRFEEESPSSESNRDLILTRDPS